MCTKYNYCYLLYATGYYYTHHGLINGVGGLVRKDTRGKTGHALLHLSLETLLYLDPCFIVHNN